MADHDRQNAPDRAEEAAQAEQGWDAPDAGVAAEDGGESVEALIRERDELKDKVLRAQAECANIAKRLEQHFAQERRLAGMGLARDMLPILDGLERTLQSMKDSGPSDPIAEGVGLLRDAFLKALGRHGIERVKAIGERFDPSLHEAMMQDPDSDQPAGTVTVEYEPGYSMHGRVLRPAKVVVSSAQTE